MISGGEGTPDPGPGAECSTQRIPGCPEREGERSTAAAGPVQNHPGLIQPGSKETTDSVRRTADHSNEKGTCCLKIFVLSFESVAGSSNGD